jgi:ABC-2 type transport system permease protein
MRAILNIARNELRLIFVDRSIWLNLIVIPVVVAFAVGFANGAVAPQSSDRPVVRLDILDQDASALSRQLADSIALANPSLTLCPGASGEDDPCALEGAALDETLGRSRLESGQSLALLVIPRGFAEAVQAGEDTSIVYQSDEQATAPSFILQAVQAAAGQVGAAAYAGRTGSEIAGQLSYVAALPDDQRAALRENIAASAAQTWAQSPVSVREVVSGAGDDAAQAASVSGFQQSVTGIGSMYVMFAVFPAIAALIRERSQWTFQRMLTMPVTTREIVAGKMLGRFIIGMIQYGVLFGFGFLLGNTYGDDPVALILLMVSFVLCITALTLLLTTFIRTEQQAAGLTLFIALTLAPLGGAWWPLDIVPEWMRIAGHISPVAWVMDGYQSLLYFGGGLGDVLPFIGVLLGMTAVFFLIGARRFNTLG